MDALILTLLHIWKTIDYIYYICIRTFRYVNAFYIPGKYHYVVRCIIFFTYNLKWTQVPL